ncbi:hypothetical protein Hamer_G023972 [Homarus americanus]|uniref:Uncharacterized protein n=1 Tax=Homarus americanus TaxID=6706 RepID=A0A8J5JZ51_HOMAM|nr:hypothetical protein Hamer_G023972 [Homarus americanus]
MLKCMRCYCLDKMKTHISSYTSNVTTMNNVNKRYKYTRENVTDVRTKILNDNKKTREQFEAAEQHWEKLVDKSILHPNDLRIYEAHKAAVARGHFTYDDPGTHYRVMTRLRHFLRGSCCGNACRHCVYDHANVADAEKARRVYNTAFWVDVDERPDLKTTAPSTYSIGVRGTTRNSMLRDQSELFNEEHDVDPLLFKH